METTTRIRLFNTRSVDEEEGRIARGQRRRVDTMGRGRRRRRSRAPSRPRFIFGILPTRRAMLVLLLMIGAAGPFVSLRLLAWASKNKPQAPTDDSGSDGGIGDDGGGLNPPSTVSLGPNSIPSVVRVERRASLSALPSLSDPAHRGAADGGGEGGRRDVCKNTVQGVALLADSEGRVCRRADLDRRRPGCCSALPLWSTGGRGNLHDAAEEAISSMEGHVLQDTPSLPPPPPPPPPRSSMLLRVDRRRKEAGGAEEAVAPRTLTAAGGSRQLAGHEGGGAEDGVPPEEALSTQFSCWNCDAGESGGAGSSCCASYEFCVSCCQDPRRKEEREAVRAAAMRSGHPAYGGLGFGGGGVGAVGSGKVSAPALPLEGGGGRIDDEDSYREAAFDYCAFRCRTYSGSVVHENSFRGPLKHCFGKFRPPAAPETAPGGDGRWGDGNAIRGSTGGGGGSDDGLVASQGRGGGALQLDPLLIGFIGE